MTGEARVDKIVLSGLRANPVIGVYPAERTRRQAVVIDVEIGLDLSGAAASDALEDTVNYAEIEERILHLAEESRFLLIERLAGAVGELVLEYPPVEQVRVRVAKPGAARFARAVAVEVTTGRNRQPRGER